LKILEQLIFETSEKSEALIAVLISSNRERRRTPTNADDDADDTANADEISQQRDAASVNKRAKRGSHSRNDVEFRRLIYLGMLGFDSSISLM